jgi:xylulose-5-phosphate/fructose-6-phosphate phosphoketolase
VIPILHVNGFKISERTIFGCMDDRELACLFSGYGYKPCLVEELDQIDQDLHSALCWAVDEIHQIQRRARAGRPITKPRWPMIILRTPKGWGCPKRSHGELIEGSFRAHQVPLPAAKTDLQELQALEEWLLSYRPIELLPNGEVVDRIKRTLPVNRYLRLGQNAITCNRRQMLTVPDWNQYAVLQDSLQSALSAAASLLDEALVLNKRCLRVFSPDELVSNKLSKIFEHTGRDLQWDQFTMHKGGQITEILSEHTCQG